MTAEEEVRAAWEHICAANTYYPGTAWTIFIYNPLVNGERTTLKAITGINKRDSWQAALDFTRKRQEEIRQINEEIGCIVPERQHFADNAWTHHHAGRYYEVAISVKWEVRFARILSRLTAQRDELKKGMRS